MDVPILYEDNHLLLVQKPVNIPVQGDQSGDKDLLSHLKEDIKYRYQKPGNVYLGLVHRLDRPVGGAMVFAKTSKAASRLSDLVRRNAMERTYLAVVNGKPKQASNRLVDYLYKNRQKNKVSIVSKHHKEGKKAVLDYSVIASKDGLSLLSVKLKTGRPIKFGSNWQELVRLFGEIKNMVHNIVKWANKLLYGLQALPWNTRLKNTTYC
ncbi:RluA family pseudouridine synthase [Aerococcus viridans]